MKKIILYKCERCNALHDTANKIVSCECGHDICLSCDKICYTCNNSFMTIINKAYCDLYKISIKELELNDYEVKYRSNCYECKARINKE